MVRNNLTCEETPWLATKATWEGANKLTLDIRDGVKWSDGKPFTAKDVAFTFNLGKQYPAIDKAGVWNDTFGAPAKSVDGQGQPGGVRLHRQRPPKYDGHHRAPRSSPSTSTPRSVTRPSTSTRRPSAPARSRSAPTTAAASSSTAATTTGRPTRSRSRSSSSRATTTPPRPSSSCASGELDAYWGEIPNPQKTFVEADPKNNHFWYAPNGITVLARQHDRRRRSTT